MHFNEAELSILTTSMCEIIPHVHVRSTISLYRMYVGSQTAFEYKRSPFRGGGGGGFSAARRGMIECSFTAASQA